MLNIKNLNLKKGTFKLKNINLNVKKGEHWVILGPTGSGKTLLLESITGINSPDSGAIYLKKEKINRKEINKRPISIVYQDLYLFPHLSVYENIIYPLKIKKNIKKKKDFFHRVVSLLQIENLMDRNISNLSGGEKQRVALARALMPDNEVLLLDEPFSALDSITKWSIIHKTSEIFRKLNMTIIHVTHDIEEALYLADKLAVINEGKIIQKGTVKEIFYKPDSERVAKLIKKDNLFKMKWKKNSRHFVKNGFKIFYSNQFEHEYGLVHISPSNIVISNEKLKTSARNVYRGVIKKIVYRNFGAKVLVDVGVSLSVYITKESLYELDLHEGKEIFVLFKTTAIEIIG